MHHAEEVVGPQRGSPRAAITERDLRIAGKTPGDLIDLLVRHVPDGHGIGAVAELVVPHDAAKSRDDSGGPEVVEPADDVALVELEPVGHGTVWRLYQRQPVFDGGEDAAVARIGRIFRIIGDLAWGRWRSAEREAKAEVVSLQHRQFDDVEPGLADDVADGGCDSLRAHACDHEPQVQRMLALI